VVQQGLYQRGPYQYRFIETHFFGALADERVKFVAHPCSDRLSVTLLAFHGWSPLTAGKRPELHSRATVRRSVARIVATCDGVNMQSGLANITFSQESSAVLLS
jgi:hypothetical protein